MSSWCKILSQSPTCRMDTRETPVVKAADAAATLENLRHIYLSNTENIPSLKRNGFSTHWPVLPIVTPTKRCYIQSIQLLPKRLSTSQKSLQIKHGAKINTGMRFNMNLKKMMTWSIHLAIRSRNENSSIILKKKVLIKQ